MIEEMTISRLHEMICNQKISIKELVEEYLKRIYLYDQGEDKLNSILEINPEVLSIAAELDGKKPKNRSKLYGIPILLKDNIGTADHMHTSAGSLALADSIAPSDSDIVKILRQKGAVILGKTNMTEFANHMARGMKAGYSARGGDVRSPYNKTGDPSGSSTGSAVAVTANLCAASLGTDTSGSITEPAFHNGIVGFRPSIEALSLQGVIPVSFTLDTAGPMTRSVIDSAILFSEIQNTSLDIKDVNLKETVIGIHQSSMENLSPEMEIKAGEIIRHLEKSGATIKYVSLPKVQADDIKTIQLHEFKYSLNRYLSNLPETYPIHSLKDIIEYNLLHSDQALKYGQSILLDAEENTSGELREENYLQMLLDRQKKRMEMEKQLSNLDVCILFQNDFISQYTGFPIITIPYGLFRDGMPYGFYLTASKDNQLLRMAGRIEEMIGYRAVPRLS